MGRLNKQVEMVRVNFVLWVVKVRLAHVLMVANVMINSAVSGFRDEVFRSLLSFFLSPTIHRLRYHSPTHVNIC